MTFSIGLGNTGLRDLPDHVKSCKSYNRVLFFIGNLINSSFVVIAYI